MSDQELLKQANRAKQALEPLHAMIYFAPEADQNYVAAGL
jgi:hypothetical protein